MSSSRNSRSLSSSRRGLRSGFCYSVLQNRRRSSSSTRSSRRSGCSRRRHLKIRFDSIRLD